MTGQELLVAGGGLLLIAVFGVIHLLGLRVIGWVRPNNDHHPGWGIILTFWGLGLLHLVEILAGAVTFWLLLLIPGTGGLGGTLGTSPADYLYISGICYSTLGYAQIEADGPIRLLTMFLSLGGFMLITWSATFIYRLWGRNYLDDM